MATITRLDARSGAGSWVLTGALMGILAGIVFAAFEMVVAAIMGQGLFAPLRMIGAVALGQGALPPEPTSGLVTVVPVALVVHLVLSATYGAVFGALAWAIPPLGDNRKALIGTATVYGLLLWIINFYVVAPQAFPWFGMANPIVQFVAHTFIFGTALGLLLSGARRGDEEHQGKAQR